MRRSSKSYDEDTDSKIPRVVASSPSNRCRVSRFEKSTNATGIEASQRKLDRVWRNNGEATTGNEPTTKIQSNNKLPPINCSKINLSRESSKSLNCPARIASLSSQKSYARIIQSNSRTSFAQKRETPFCNRFTIFQ